MEIRQNSLDYFDDVASDPEFWFDEDCGNSKELALQHIMNCPTLQVKLLEQYCKDLKHDINLEWGMGCDTSYLEAILAEVETDIKAILLKMVQD